MESRILTSPEQKMTLERLESLYELIGRMNSVYELQELLEFVIDRVLNVTGGRRGLLLLTNDPEVDSPRLAVIKGEGLDQAELNKTLEFVSTSVINDVLAQGEPRLVMDLRADERYRYRLSPASYVIKEVRSVLAVPLNVDGELIGLVYVDHPKRGVFGQEDLDFLRAFANQAALAINRAGQHQRQVEELTLLNDLSRSLVQVLDLDQALTEIVYQAIQMLNVETGSVLLLDAASGELTFATSVSNGQRVDIPTRLSKNQGIAGHVASTGEVVAVGDVEQDPRWFGEVETGFTTRSLLLRNCR
jgi:GAF domain-containing protein